MNKKMVKVLGLVAVMLICSIAFSQAVGQYRLAESYGSVATNIGTIPLEIGVLVGGTPTGDYIWLTEGRTFYTTEGYIEFDEGDLIQCEDETAPGYPNPCDPY